MHAVMLKFNSSVDLGELSEFFGNQAGAVTDVNGLVSTTWVADDDILGHFLLFENRACAETYLHSDICGTVLRNPAFTHFSIQHLGVIDEVTMLVRGLSPYVGTQ